MSGYNGWTNWETWNVALWIENDEGLYTEARRCYSYTQFSTRMVESGMAETPDGVDWDDAELDTDELDTLLEEL